MSLIKGLYNILAIVTSINVITLLYCFWPRAKQNVPMKSTESQSIWTRKDAVWLILMIIAVVCLIMIVLILSYIYKVYFVMAIIILSYVLRQVVRSFPSAQTLGNIVKGKANKILGANEYFSIVTLAITVTYFNSYGILDKAIEYARCQSNSILSDWMLLGLCVCSIAITAFFICSLALKPIKIMAQACIKICSHIGRRNKSFFTKLENHINSPYNTKTLTAVLIDHSKIHGYIFCAISWLFFPIAAVLDILRIILFLTYSIAISCVWYIMCIAIYVLKISSKIGKWILSLSDQHVVAISFRIATILGFGCTVIINQYEPFLKNQGTTTVFEFISSTIIIPIILEWVLSYKANVRSGQS